MIKFRLVVLCLLAVLSQNVYSGTPHSGNVKFSGLFTLADYSPMFSELASLAEMPADKLPPQGKKVPIAGNTAQLKYFFTALKSAKSKKVRVAHWGDSILLGDIITYNLRINFQDEFGGSGPGFITMNCDDYGMRKSTIVDFSKDWKEGSLFKRNPDKLPIGIGGAVYSPTDNSYVSYTLGKLPKNAKAFNTFRVFYTNAKGGGKVNVLFGNNNNQSANLLQGNDLKEATFSGLNVNYAKLTFNGASNAQFYGVSLEGDNGVYVDNLPLRGLSGVTMVDMNKDILRKFRDMLNYKLIVLNFGVNVVSPEHNEYTWYEKMMIKTVEHLKAAFPETSILIVSVSDKGGQKVGNKFLTEKNLPLVIQAQRSVAEKTGVAFWNLFEAMGGNNVINEWVNKNPPLAEKDYTHFTMEGGKVVADMLYQALMDEYKK